MYAERAENAELWDVEGSRYIDFASGIAVLNTGHVHPKVKAAVAAAARKAHARLLPGDALRSYIALAENAQRDGAGRRRPKKTIFLSTGAEAVENAIKIARYATKRSAVIAFSGGFHGRTLACIRAHGQGAALQGRLWAHAAGGVSHVPFPMAYHGVTAEHSLRALEQLFKADVDPAARRRHHHRAGAGRRRLLHRAAGVPRSACARSATSTASC